MNKELNKPITKEDIINNKVTNEELLNQLMTMTVKEVAELLEDVPVPCSDDDEEYQHQSFKSLPNYKAKGHIKPFFIKGRW